MKTSQPGPVTPKVLIIGSRASTYSSILGLDEEPIYENKLEEIPEDEKEVILPTRTRESDTGDECVVEARDVDPKVVHSHAFRAGVIPETLDGVQGLERGEACSKDEAEDEDYCNLRFGLLGIDGGLVA